MRAIKTMPSTRQQTRAICEQGERVGRLTNKCEQLVASKARE